MAELLNLRRFLELERRVGKIETKLGMTDQPAAVEVSLGFDEPLEPPVAQKAPSDSVGWEISREAVTYLEPPAPAKPQAAMPPPLPVMLQDLNARKAQARGEIPRLAPVVMYAEPEKKKPRNDTGSALETMIGLNWTGWIGALVLVVGAALGIKYGYEQGWFSGMPKSVRLGFCFSAGLALLGVGEWVDRRVNRISSAGVFAAGIATLFVVSYAGFGYFELYAQPTAFVLMGIATLVGSFIALRKNLVVIGTLSLLGGNIAPIVLHTNEPRLAALLGYILALQLVALFLANVGKGGKWWILRGFAIAMPTLWTGVAYLQSQTMVLPLVYSIVYAVLVQVELIFASRRTEAQQRGLIAPASILVTGLLTVSLLWGLHDHSRQHQGLAMLILAAACYAPGLILRKVLDELSFAYRVSAALLLLVAVPVGLTGAPVIWAWAGLSIAYVIVGRKLGSELGWKFGLGAWILAVGYLAQWSYLSPAANAVMFLGLPAYCVSAVGLAVVGHVMSQLLVKQQSAVAVTIDILASLVFLAGLTAMEGWHATAAVTGYAWAMFIAGRLLGRDTWELHGGALLLVALVKWACVDMLSDRFTVGVRTAKYLPVVNPLMGMGTAIAASLVGMYAMQRKQLDERLSSMASSGAMAVATFIIAMMTFGLSVEIADVARTATGTWPRWTLRHMGWTMLWTSAIALHAGLILKLVAVADRRRWLGGTAFMMLTVAAKFLILDVMATAILAGGRYGAPVVNVQTLACLVVVGGLGLVWWLRDRHDLAWGLGGAMLLAVLLVVGTVEIGRTFSHYSDRFAMQVAVSIYWAVFAVSAIVAGFRMRIAGLRYFGLTLLAVALIKVVGFDLKEIGHGYRILSFIGLGGLLLATSVVYGKLSPILLTKEETPAAV